VKLYSLIKGEERYATPLTRGLTDGITYLPPRCSGRQYPRLYLCYLKYLVLHPLKTANLIRLYQNELEGGPCSFVDHRSVENIFHPLHGFHFAGLLKKQPIAHVHAYCTHIPTNLALVAAHLLDLGFSFTAYVDFDFPYPFKMLDRKLELCDFAVVHTLFCKERLVGYTSERYRDKIHLVRIILDLEKFTPRPPSGSGRMRLLCVGGLVPKKGHRHLLRACRILKDEGREFELLIVGDGPLRDRLRGLVSELGLEDRVTFRGGLAIDEVMDCYTPDATLVQPSVYAPDGERDGMPTVVAEAMAMGTPVISTYVSGIPEVIQDGHNGLLVLPENPRALADAAVRMHEDAGLRARCIENGRKTAREVFDSARWIPGLERLLRGSLGGA